jgi:hypothetical protein
MTRVAVDCQQTAQHSGFPSQTPIDIPQGHPSGLASGVTSERQILAEVESGEAHSDTGSDKQK